MLCAQADERLLQPKSGFFGGMGERGIGGSKCGSTAAVALAFREGGTTKLLAANVGDARVLLSRKGKALQLTTDHVPDRHASVRGTLARPACSRLTSWQPALSGLLTKAVGVEKIRTFHLSALGSSLACLHPKEHWKHWIACVLLASPPLLSFHIAELQTAGR